MLCGPNILSENFQVCVVGAGPVGIAVALTLARSGIKTLLIESGDTRARSPGRRYGQSDLDPGRAHGTDRETLAIGLGGTSSRWGGRCVPLDDIDFEPRDYAGSPGWPIDHDAIKPFYPAAADILKCGFDRGALQTHDDFLASPESWAFPRNTAAANRIELANSSQLHIVLGTHATAICLDRSVGRIRGLNVVCNGRPMSVKAEHFVLACGGRANARMLLNLQADAPDLFGGSDGPLGRFYMGHLSGQIAKIRFRSQSIAERFLFRRHEDGYFCSNRLQPSPSAQRNLRIMNVALWPHNADVAMLPPSSAAASAAFFREIITRKRKGTRHELLGHGLSLARNPRAVLISTIGTLKSYYLDGLPFLQLRSPNNEYTLRYHSEQRPTPDNRVRLSHQKDQYGQRLIDTSFDYCPDDYRSVVIAHQALNEWLKHQELGAITFVERDQEQHVARQAKDGWHQIGLTRMGKSRRDGVVDANCRTFDIDNLYVAGSSVFVSSGQANPTLPAVSFGVRLARQVAVTARAATVSI